MLQQLTTPRAWQYFYAVASALLAVLVGYDIVAPDQVPLWLGFLAALFAVAATSTASVVVAEQRKDGTLD